MAAAETLDISDLVFVNWGNDEYEISSISDDDLAISSGNECTSKVEDLELDASYVNVNSSDTSKVMATEDVDYDLSILLHLFDDYPDRLKENYPDFPHLFLKTTIPRTSIMVFIALCVGLFSILLSSVTILPKTDVNASVQSQQALIYAEPVDSAAQIYHVNKKSQAQIIDKQDDIKKFTKETIPEKESQKTIDKSLLDFHKQRQKSMMDAFSWYLSKLRRILAVIKKIIIMTQAFIKKRLYEFRKKIRFLFK